MGLQSWIIKCLIIIDARRKHEDILLMFSWLLLVFAKTHYTFFRTAILGNYFGVWILNWLMRITLFLAL